MEHLWEFIISTLLTAFMLAIKKNKEGFWVTKSIGLLKSFWIGPHGGSGSLYVRLIGEETDLQVRYHPNFDIRLRNPMKCDSNCRAPHDRVFLCDATANASTAIDCSIWMTHRLFYDHVGTKHSSTELKWCVNFRRNCISQHLGGWS